MSIPHDQLRFERLGHASVRIETEDGTVIYIDPWSDVLDEEPADGDVVFVTHDDPDHFDPSGIRAVSGPDVTVAAYEAVDTSGLDARVVDLPAGSTVTVDGIKVRTVPAYNDPTGKHVDETGAPFHAEGEVIGLILEIEDTSVYFPSDTDFLEEHASISADVFIPPIGGHYTMDRHEAAAFARSVEPDLVLPVHYDTFEAIRTDAVGFAQELEEEGIRVDLF